MTNRTCDECKWDGGIHYVVPDDGGEIVATRCPNFYAADLLEQAHKATTDAHTQAFKAAKQIVRDATETLPEFSANDLRDLMDAASIDSPVIGAAFSWAQREGLIEPAGRMVQSTEATTRHRIFVWRSLRYGKRGAA